MNLLRKIERGLKAAEERKRKEAADPIRAAQALGPVELRRSVRRHVVRWICSLDDDVYLRFLDEVTTARQLSPFTHSANSMLAEMKEKAAQGDARAKEWLRSCPQAGELANPPDAEEAEEAKKQPPS